ncbi:MAG: hypothetical protein H6569_04330 [Lewinellaceae bacterium]|nr:hypothetical protein [Lewinellaceae bacterium]
MKNTLHLCLFSGIFALLLHSQISAQGCVAIRQVGGCGAASATTLLAKGEWQANLNYRYFRSFRHFRGDHEEMNRVEMGTEVINIAHIADLGLAYSLTNRLSLAANLPIIFYDRSSLYEHYGNSSTANPEQKRFHTNSRGIGDLRLAASYWLFNPEQHSTYNIALGAGIKLPTGNSNVQDAFHKRSTVDGSDSTTIRAVDQSIQLGDGGVGFTIELQAYASLTPRATLYANGFYLSNPRNTNNTLTRGTLDNTDPLIAYHSVADQYLARLGLNYLLLPTKSLAISLGGRIEGIPPQDFIGKSDGFRRPGYIVAAEPGINFQNNRFSIALTVPVAIYRNRTKSTYDLADPNGQRHGDAAFADYSINLGVGYRFGGNHPAMDMPAPGWKEVGQ